MRIGMSNSAPDLALDYEFLTISAMIPIATSPAITAKVIFHAL